MGYFTEYFTEYFGEATAPPVVEDQPSGGYLAHNQAQLERNRRRREELEDEADRLEAALIEAQVLPPNPIVTDRITVREYAPHLTSRRTQRAVDYAQRAKTALAYQLAAREIAKALEEDELAIVTLLAHIA